MLLLRQTIWAATRLWFWLSAEAQGSRRRVDENQELDRKSVIAKAEEQGMTIIALHIGGSARRGTLSDKFIRMLMAADAAIIGLGR